MSIELKPGWLERQAKELTRQLKVEKKRADDHEAELERHATDRVNQRKELAEAQEQVRTLTEERDTARELGVTEARNAVANNSLLISECDAHKVRAEAAEQRNRELKAALRDVLRSVSNRRKPR